MPASSVLEAAFDELRKNAFGNPHTNSPSSRRADLRVEKMRMRRAWFFFSVCWEHGCPSGGRVPLLRYCARRRGGRAACFHLRRIRRSRLSPRLSSPKSLISGFSCVSQDAQVLQRQPGGIPGCVHQQHNGRDAHRRRNLPVVGASERTQHSTTTMGQTTSYTFCARMAPITSI